MDGLMDKWANPQKWQFWRKRPTYLFRGVLSNGRMV